jgi:hypothetical protein
MGGFDVAKISPNGNISKKALRFQLPLTGATMKS